VAGIDAATAGANIHVWKLKDDLSIDTSFKPVNLGDAFEYPTASNSSCMQNPNSVSSCFRLESLTVNETANTYAVTYAKNVSVGSGMNAQSTEITSIAIGNLATGAAPATRNFFRSTSPLYDPTQDFAAYNATRLYGDMCTSTFGATYQGAALSSTFADGFNTLIRPDGSVVLSVSCFYSSGTMNSLTEYRASAMFALKASGASIVPDTTWGTNGVLKTYDDPTQCGNSFPMGSIDTSITSNSSPKLYTLLWTQTYPRQTTWTGSGQQITNYNGCNTNGMPPYNSSRLVSLKADGAILATANFTSQMGPGRWIIDSSGRWNSIIMSGSGQNVTYSLIRLNTKGELDTTNGANGQKALTGLPSTVTVNGTSVTMRYSITGIATTANGFLFSGFSSAGNMPSSFICNSPTTYSATAYPYYMTVENGLVTTYGTNGLGEGVTTQFQTECNSSGTAVSFINAKGQHASVILTRAIGSQAAGIKYTVWDAAQGVTSGGDGTGVVGAGSPAGRVDTKVYSTRLPAAAQADSALRVLTAQQAEDLDIRSNTPRICVALTTSVLMVNPGRCVVRIIDEDTKRVIRTMTTVVKKTEVEDGTTLTTDEPIFFRQASIRLSKNALAQVAELAEAAKGASRVVVIGHSAAIGEVSQYSFAISRNRANAVRTALIRAGVKVPIEIVAMSYNQPEKTAKTEAAQALNRRAEVYIFPK